MTSHFDGPALEHGLGDYAGPGSASHPSDYASANSLSTHSASPGNGAGPRGESPGSHAPQQQQQQQQASSFYAGASAGASGAGDAAYSGAPGPNDGPPRQNLPPLTEALHTDSVGPHDEVSRFAHQVGPGGGAPYDPHESHFLGGGQHVMDPTGSSSGPSQHQQQQQQQQQAQYTANGGGPPGGQHHGYHAHAAASSAGMMTPPPPGSSGGHGAYASHYAPPASHMLHRASISGPIMSHHYAGAPGHAGPSGSATPTHMPHGHMGAPPHAGDFAAWGTPSGSARPHTADGMFGGQFGAMSSQWNGAMPPGFMRGPRHSTSSISSISEAGGSGGSKIFSYIAGGTDDGMSGSVGANGKKRPRRRYDEIERLYPCAFPGCAKSYGTLNHLNAHVAMQKHGAKRAPGEFKEMRKAWRKGKREEEQRRQHGDGDSMHRASISSQGTYPGSGVPAPHGYAAAHQAHQQALAAYGGPGAPMASSVPGQVPRYSLPGGQPGFMNPPQHFQPSPFDGNGRPYTSAGMMTPQQHHHHAQQQQQQQQSPSQHQQGQPGPPGGLGAYLMAHRGSI